MSIEISIDAGELQRLNQQLLLLTDRNMRFAVSRALTASGKAAQLHLQRSTPVYITNPTRWTLNGTYTRYAKPSSLEVEIGFRSETQGRGNPSGRYLQPIAAGELPRVKAADLSASKLAGVSRSAVLIPARSAGLLDAAGNVPLRKQAQILAAARAGGRSGVYIAPVRRGSSVMAIFERKEGFLGRTSTVERTTRRLFTLDPSPKARQRQFPVRDVIEQGFAQAWRREMVAAFDAELARATGASR